MKAVKKDETPISDEEEAWVSGEGEEFGSDADEALNGEEMEEDDDWEGADAEGDLEENADEEPIVKRAKTEAERKDFLS